MSTIQIIIAIDPGPKQSAIVRYWDGKIEKAYTVANEVAVESLRYLTTCGACDWTLVIEKVASFGMAVGEEVFETVFWSGRFAEAWEVGGGRVERMTRMAVKMHLCHDSRAKDANIRQALIDRFGGKATAIGRKATPGPLHGIKGDEWSALAVAVCFADGAAGQAAGDSEREE